MAGLSLKLLGPVQVTLDGQPVPGFHTSKVQALLIYRAVERTIAHRRKHLMTLLWPRMPEKSARHNLRQVLYQLRKAIPELPAKQGGADAEAEDPAPLLLSDRQTIQLNPAADVEVDVERFMSIIKETQSHNHPDLNRCATCRVALEAAVALYRGEFLVDFYLEDSALFEDWAAAQREYYRRQILRALETLADDYLQAKAYEQAHTYAERQLAIDNLRESGHRQLMECLALRGQRAEALRHYEKLGDLLRRELGVGPTAETEALAEAIRAEMVGKDEGAKPSAEMVVSFGSIVQHELEIEPSPIPNNLPPQPTPFIGREKELIELGALIADPEVRLVTIVGPGGMGKTRLALAAAEAQLETNGREPAYPDGVYIASLASISAADQLIPSLAGVLNFQVQGAQQDPRPPRQQVVDYLRRKRMLLILDQFEHFLDPVPGETSVGSKLLLEIWQTAPEVQLLITTRERAKLHMEQVYRLGGMAYLEEETSAAGIEYEAAQLFLQAARRAQPAFQTAGGEEMISLNRICRLVGGIPLALELAAGWVDILSMTEIAAEIETSLDFLETELSGMSERHRGMRAVFESTWGRLTQEEQEVLARFSVFRGGCAREAAQAVTGASLRTLARLSDKSQIQYQKGKGRYQIHELLRQYGAEKLAIAPEAEAAAQDRHSAFYCSELGRSMDLIKAGQMPTAMAVIEKDIDNIQAAWDWALARLDGIRLDQGMEALCIFYDWFWRVREGWELCQTLLEKLMGAKSTLMAADEPSEVILRRRVLIQTLTWRGLFGYSLKPFEEAKGFLEQGLSQLKKLEERGMDASSEKAFALYHQGVLKKLLDEQGASRQYFLESLELYRAVGDPWWELVILGALGGLARHSGAYDEAKGWYKKYLAVARAQQNPWEEAKALEYLGWIARLHVSYEEARQLFESSLALANANGNVWGVIRTTESLGFLSIFLGDLDDAQARLKKCITLNEALGTPERAMGMRGILGIACMLAGDYEQAEAYIRADLSMAQEVGLGWALSHPTVTYAKFLAMKGRYTAATDQLRVVDQMAGEMLPVNPGIRTARIRGWVALGQGEFDQAYAHFQESLVLLKRMGDDEQVAWAQAGLGRAAMGLGKKDGAQRVLFAALQICVAIHAFIPLVHLLPMLPVVLAANVDDHLKVRAVELYALAESLPFVSNSQFFTDVAGKPLAAMVETLSPKVVEAAQARGRQLDLWETAETLLEELSELGWDRS